MNDNNPLKPIYLKAQMFMGFFIASIISIDLLMVLFGTASSFQRLGSFYVALLLMLFGLTRVVAIEVRKALAGRGVFAEQAKEVLAPVTFSEDKGWLNYMSADGVEYEEPLATTEEIRAHFDDFEDNFVPNLTANELFIGALATLQWGYGDLFHCWINGNGWTTC